MQYIFNKGFVHYLWCDLLTSNNIVSHSRQDKSAHNRQLLTVVLYSKQAILAN